MSTPVPGQRVAQRPLRAAVATQAALGRSTNTSGAVSDSMILNVGGHWKQVVDDYLVDYEFGSDDNPEGE